MSVNNRADGVLVAHPPFQAEGSGSIPTSALQFGICYVTYPQAQELNALWHSTLPRIGDPANVMAKTPCFVASFNGAAFAVAIWSHPVSRKLPQKEWLELRRLAVGPDAPKNTASRMLAVMARLLRKQRPELTRLISYQDLDAHTGCIYRAAGWLPTVVSKFNTWNKPNSRNLSGNPRIRPSDQSKADKQRWEKVLYERADEAGTDCPLPAGTEANVPLPERADGRAGKRHALTGSLFGNTSIDDG